MFTGISHCEIHVDSARRWTVAIIIQNVVNVMSDLSLNMHSETELSLGQSVAQYDMSNTWNLNHTNSTTARSWTLVQCLSSISCSFSVCMCCRHFSWEGHLNSRKRWFPSVWTQTVPQSLWGTSQSQRASIVSSTQCQRTTNLIFSSFHFLLPPLKKISNWVLPVYFLPFIESLCLSAALQWHCLWARFSDVA